MTSWRNDSVLAGRFHPDYPDDLQVIVHDGSFRFSTNPPEVMWGRIIEKVNWEHASGEAYHVYKAQLLNQPHNLTSVKLGQEVHIIAHKNYQYCVYVTDAYLKDRANYVIQPCNNCGLPEVLDPISKLIETSFPNIEEEVGAEGMMMFTSFCPNCGQNGHLIVKHHALEDSDAD